MLGNSKFEIQLETEIIGSEIIRKYRSYIDDKKGYLICKRIFDIVISVLVLLFILSWLFPILAVLIKMDSRGPIFFLQKRVGRGCRSFFCYKFRSMIFNTESDRKQAEENDYRITRIGKFLRKSNLDELPQFLNVLKGEMSVVGPRPHMHSDCKRFSAQIGQYKFRNLLRPGITGLAQIKGFSGPAIHFEDVFRRYQWDAYYVRAASFWMDLKIICKTFSQHLFLIFFSTYSSQALVKDPF